MCDRVNHCSDGSDETGECLNEASNPDRGPCYSNAFDCGNQKCISVSFVCDHINHCDDGRDEMFCCKYCQI